MTRSDRTYRPYCEELESRLVPAMIGTPNQNFVAQLYQDVLHRNVDPTGLAFWSRQLDTGTLNRLQVALSIQKSPEGITDLVNDQFNRFLHRNADPTGLSAFVPFIAQGNSTTNLAALIISSPEFFMSRGGGTDAGFLNALFNDALNRPIDAASLASFDHLLTTGALSRFQAAQIVLGSPEGRIHQAESYYTSYLRRPGEVAGVTFWAAVLKQQQGNETILNEGPLDDNGGDVDNNPDAVVVTQFLGSQEYFMDAQTNEGFATIPTNH